jgi:hypothetical protein
MAEKHDALLEDAKRAADRLHADWSVETADTLSSLEKLRDHVEMLVDSVKYDYGDEKE